MEPNTYQRIRRRSHGFSGFRLNSRSRFSVSKLRSKFVRLLKILNRWRLCSYSRRRCGRSKTKTKTKASAVEVAEFPRCGECRLRSFRRSNSFYAEAIADCLDFIKRSSVSFDRPPTQSRIEFRDPSSVSA